MTELGHDRVTAVRVNIETGVCVDRVEGITSVVWRSKGELTKSPELEINNLIIHSKHR